MAQPADSALGDQVAHLDPLRVVDHHEGFADLHLFFVAQLYQRQDILGVERQRLFHQHMLSGFNGPGCPFDMLRGRQRDIDAVDFRRGQKLLIRAEGMARTEAFAKRLRFGKIAAGDGRQNAVVGLDDRRDKMVACDLGRR